MNRNSSSLRWAAPLRRLAGVGGDPHQGPPLSQGPPASGSSTTRPDSPDSSDASDSTIRERPGARHPQETHTQEGTTQEQTHPPLFERTCAVTVNESFAHDEVLLNLDHFDDGVQAGQLLAMDVLPERGGGGGHGPGPTAGSNNTAEAGSSGTGSGTAGGGRADLDPERRYLFIVKDMPAELKARHPSVEIYVAKRIADAFGMKKGSTVLLRGITPDNPAVEASHVELVFKDQYLSRADMWRMAVAALAQRTIYRGQRVLFMSTIKATVTHVFVDGRPVQSAFFGRSTRPIFRSESARFVLFIQMAREMWDFDSDCSGEIVFSKVVNDLLPSLFNKWLVHRVRHLVTIVFFARVEYDTGLAADLAEPAVHHPDAYYTGVTETTTTTVDQRRPYKDFYHVVVSEMPSTESSRILYQLKREFVLFRRDISLHHLAAGLPQHIRAASSAAMHGNVLEAIDMAATLFSHDYVDRDLLRTGISVVVISPGSGVFDVDYAALRRTTEALTGNGIGIDLLCVPRVPLHCVPLFRFRHPRYEGGGLAGGGHHHARPRRSSHSHSSSPYGASLSTTAGTSLSTTPKTATTPVYGSYSSIGASAFTPGAPGGRATSDLASTPGSAPRDYLSAASAAATAAAARATRTDPDYGWVYVLPQWLHVSYWASEPGELLLAQGRPPPRQLALEGADRRRRREDDDEEGVLDAFEIRCRMYDLQMRGVLETNEIETTPLHMDPQFPRGAFRLLSAEDDDDDDEDDARSSSSSSGTDSDRDAEWAAPVVVIRNTIPANVLFDQVHGFYKYAADRLAKQDTKSVWKQLQAYDATRQRVQTGGGGGGRTRRPGRGTGMGTTLRGQNDRKSDKKDEAKPTTPKPTKPPIKSSMADTTTTTTTTTPRTTRSVSFRPPPPSLSSRASSTASSTRTATSTAKPKVLRQISLGHRGFGIAAPKAAVAEVSVETVAAVTKPLGAKAIGHSSPAAITTSPSRRRRHALADATEVFDFAGDGRLGLGLGRTRPLIPDAPPSRPISIRSGMDNGSSNSTAGPVPASLAATAATATTTTTTASYLQTGLTSYADLPRDNRELRYSDILRAEDAQRQKASSSSSAKEPASPASASLTAPALLSLSPITGMAPWLVPVNPSKPEANRYDAATINGRWHHVFPRPGETRAMRWKTLCCPAAVPLTTELFPSRAQLEAEYQQHPYSVSPEGGPGSSSSDDSPPRIATAADLLREMISMRLSQGFQVVTGPAVAKALSGQRPMRIADIFPASAAAAAAAATQSSSGGGPPPPPAFAEGTTLFMAIGNTIHQLSYANAAEVQVNIYQRGGQSTKSSSSSSAAAAAAARGDDESSTTTTLPPPPPPYRPAVRTLLDRGYHTSAIDRTALRPEHNWNYIDSYLAGHDEQLTEKLRFWRARFVLIPTQRPSAANSSSASSSAPGLGPAGDNDEEIRIEGIRKLGQLWQKHRVVPAAERRFLASLSARHQRKKKDPNPLDVVYKTEDPSLVIAAELETLPLLEGGGATATGTSEAGGPPRRTLVTSREQFRRSEPLHLAALADAMQQPVEHGGVRLQNRRWHLRLHANCFIGTDMTSWLLDNFEDLESREEAEALGNLLMVREPDSSAGQQASDADAAADAADAPASASASASSPPQPQGLFVHVEKRHAFRDGQYFYQIASEYAKPHNNSNNNNSLASPAGWFNAARRAAAVPTTPTIDTTATDGTPTATPSLSAISTTTTSGTTALSSTTTTTTTTTTTDDTTTNPPPHHRRPRVVLSKRIQLDVDPRRRSYRPERIDLHYDRLHNPDNCYHLRIEWMNATAKLIHDAVETWARDAAQHGLRLVEVPIAEAASISAGNPLRRPYRVVLARAPPAQRPATYLAPQALAPPQAQPGRHVYQTALLRRFHFVLDTEAAANFPPTVDVRYSWGRPDYRYSQYIHRSGIILAQIDDHGNFLLLVNRLYSNRTATAGAGPSSSSSAASSAAAAAAAAAASATATPCTTPPLSTAGLGEDPETVMDELEAFCSNPNLLEAFYREVMEGRVEGRRTMSTGTATSSTMGGGGGGGGGGSSSARSVAGTPVALQPMCSPSGSGSGSGSGASVRRASRHGSGGGAVPDTSIPALGLPPGILSGATAGPTPAPAPARRPSSAGFVASRLFLRQSSTDEGQQGERETGGA